MKALIFQTVTREEQGTGANKRRRRAIDESSFYAIPESVTIGPTTTRLLTDSLQYSEVTQSLYSVPENAWRNDQNKAADWRKYQTVLNRARRSVGVHGAAYVELLGESPTIPSDTVMPTGSIKSFTETGYLTLVENDIDTQNEWDEGDLPAQEGDPQDGVLLRLARNNAVFFIPNDHLGKYKVLDSNADRKFKAAKSLFGHKPGSGSNPTGKRIAPSPRLIGIKNIFKTIGGISPAVLPTGQTNPDAPSATGVINSFTEGGKILDVMEELRDFDDDVLNDVD